MPRSHRAFQLKLQESFITLQVPIVPMVLYGNKISTIELKQEERENVLKLNKTFSQRLHLVFPPQSTSALMESDTADDARVRALCGGNKQRKRHEMHPSLLWTASLAASIPTFALLLRLARVHIHKIHNFSWSKRKNFPFYVACCFSTAPES